LTPFSLVETLFELVLGRPKVASQLGNGGSAEDDDRQDYNHDDPIGLLRSWRWAIVIITVVSAVATPSSDPFSMLALAIPLVLFYFVSVGIGKLFGR
jgi:hypothetical protein